MTCPYLNGDVITVCTIHGVNIIPNNIELEKYCRNDKAKSCPYPTLRLYGIGRTNQCGASRNLPKEAA